MIQEFKINEYLTLRLESVYENNKINRWKTMIYVAGERFRQCSQLVVNIPTKEISTFDEIQSIDEAIEKLEINMDEIDHKIPPETEFWGHCSNLQVWAERNYDTRILHSNLAFPLLKTLAKAGDKFAEIKLKEEIVKRFASGYPSVVKFLIKELYIDYLTREELLFGILEPEEAEVITKLDAICGENLYLTDEFYDELDLCFMVRKRHVIELSLSFLKLKTFPEEITKLKFVKKLYLGGNCFSTVPESIRNLKKLQTLFIFDNELSNLPESLGELDSLKHLILLNNNLNCLPESIGILKSLRLLDLEENQLMHIPESIGNLVSLEELFLNFNQIVELPEAILKLNSLKILHLRGVFLARTISATEKNSNIIKKLEAKGVNIITKRPSSLNLPRYSFFNKN